MKTANFLLRTPFKLALFPAGAASLVMAMTCLSTSAGLSTPPASMEPPSAGISYRITTDAEPVEDPAELNDPEPTEGINAFDESDTMDLTEDASETFVPSENSDSESVMDPVESTDYELVEEFSVADEAETMDVIEDTVGEVTPSEYGDVEDVADSTAAFDQPLAELQSNLELLQSLVEEIRQADTVQARSGLLHEYLNNVGTMVAAIDASWTALSNSLDVIPQQMGTDEMEGTDETVGDENAYQTDDTDTDDMEEAPPNSYESED